MQPLNELARAARRWADLSQEVRRQLAERPLPQVHRDLITARHPSSAQHLNDTQQLSDEQLEQLGIPGDLLRAFSKAGEFDYQPTAEGLALLPEHARSPVRQLRLQLPSSPQSVALGLKLLRDLLLGLAPDIAINVALPPAANVDAMRRLCTRWISNSRKLRFCPLKTHNLFSQDNAKTAVLADGGRCLVLPRTSLVTRDKHERNFGEAFGLPVVSSRLLWEGGNLLADGRACLVGVNTIAANCIHFGLTPRQVVAAFEAEFSAPLVMLGDLPLALSRLRQDISRNLDDRPPDEPGNHRLELGQADFHIDLDVLALGDAPDGTPQVALADPQAGLELRDAICARDGLFEGHFLPPDQMRKVLRSRAEKTAARRHQRLQLYRRQLAAAGYQVIDIPDFRVAAGDQYLGRVNFNFNFVNVLPHGTTHQAGVYLWQFGIPEVDAAARRAYENRGIQTTPLGDATTANEITRLMGGLHCASSKLA